MSRETLCHQIFWTSRSLWMEKVKWDLCLSKDNLFSRHLSLKWSQWSNITTLPCSQSSPWAISQTFRTPRVPWKEAKNFKNTHQTLIFHKKNSTQIKWIFTEDSKRLPAVLLIVTPKDKLRASLTLNVNFSKITPHHFLKETCPCIVLKTVSRCTQDLTLNGRWIQTKCRSKIVIQVTQK